MRQLPQRLLRHRFVLLYLAIYFLVLAALRVFEGFDLFLPLFVLIVMGGVLSALALWLTRRVGATASAVRQPGRESLVLTLYLTLVVGWYLTVGADYVHTWFDEGPARTLAVLITKLIVWVIVPYLLFRVAWKYRFRDLADISFDPRTHGRVVLGMLVFILPYQALVGQGVGQIRAAQFLPWQLLVGAVFTFVWLIVEVGLVEEFSYRVLLQSRLTALLRSDAGGILLMALLFGVTHAPGLYLRGGGGVEALGTSPSLLAAFGYSVVVLSPAGIFLGVLWACTRNLWVVLLVHAGFDSLPHLTELSQTFFGF